MSRITCRPIYDSRRRSIRGQVWGVFAGDVLTAITVRYPSQLMRELV